MRSRSVFHKLFAVALVAGALSVVGCEAIDQFSGKKKDPAERKANARLAMFVGVDISGSFVRSKNFRDSLRFAAHYIYAHLRGYGGLEVPAALFVGSIGGAKKNEPKTFYPIQTFQHKSIKQIERKLFQIFPKTRQNRFTDYNAFFKQVAVFVRNKNLIMRPLSIVLLSDGRPDVPGSGGKKHNYRRIEVQPLENLSRNITVRVLYTSADVGTDWTTKIPRRRVKVWTQDAPVMRMWKDPSTLLPNRAFAKQDRFFAWILDNVDFPVRSSRVN